nr:glutamate [NMDA] receptor subunit 1-like [Cherax quadricarinatus]
MPYITVHGLHPPFMVAGTMISLMRLMAAKLNYCVEFVVPNDVQFGDRLPNGSWSGLMGLLHRREVNMSGVIVGYNVKRTPIIDYSTPLYIDSSKIIYKRPVFPPDITGFVKPYTSTMWLLLALTILLVFFILMVFLWLHDRLEEPDSASRYTDVFQST